MQWRYFQGEFDSMVTLRAFFHKLCLELHPDKHPNEAEKYKALFQDMMNEYEEFLLYFIPGQNQAQRDKKSPEFTQEAETDLAQVIADLMKFSALVIEICGSWLWVSGNTYSIKEQLKDLGFKWQHSKKLWYFAGYEFKPRKRKIMSMDHIYTRYGRTEIRTEEAEAVS